MPDRITYLHLPIDSRTGWGVVGIELTRAMAALAPAQLLIVELEPHKVEDEPLRHELAALAADHRALGRFLGRDGFVRLDGPLVTAIPDYSFEPDFKRLVGDPLIGYTFFEANVLSREAVESARHWYGAVATGSTWCTETLKRRGVNAFTALPGVDGRMFHPLPECPPRTFEPDRFVVFSGGKFEFRKGQDVAIRAYKVLQDRHPDVFLVAAWHNPWDWSFDTMADSTLIRFRRPRRLTGAAAVERVLADNGVDLSRVLALGQRPRSSLARTYHDSDVGLFPSRAEGTNLVLLEYMACGKPAVATATTGHADLVDARNALLIETGRERKVRDEHARVVASWPEPSLESAVEQLEWAYRNRGKLAALGARAARDASKRTWASTARAILKGARP